MRTWRVSDNWVYLISTSRSLLFIETAEFEFLLWLLSLSGLGEALCSGKSSGSGKSPGSDDSSGLDDPSCFPMLNGSWLPSMLYLWFFSIRGINETQFRDPMSGQVVHRLDSQVALAADACGIRSLSFILPIEE